LALFSRKAQKDTEIPFSNEAPIISPEKTRKLSFQIEDIDIIFQRFPSQVKKKNGKPLFKYKKLVLFSRKTQINTEIPFSNEISITSPEKTRKFRFQIKDIDIIFQRLPSQAKKNNGNPVFKEKMLVLFSRGSHHKFKKKKSRFQIEDIGIIFPNSQNKIGRQTIFK
jgi:hypothetical protein